MRRLLQALFVLIMLSGGTALAQFGSPTIIIYPGVPTGTCSPTTLGKDAANGFIYSCGPGNSWLLVGPTAAAGNPGGSANQVQFNSGGTTFAGFTMSGDCTLTVATGIIVCTGTNGTAFGTFATQNYATPPAIGGTTPAAGAFTTVSGSTVSGSTSVTDSAMTLGSVLFAGTAGILAQDNSNLFYTVGSHELKLALQKFLSTGGVFWDNAGTADVGLCRAAAGKLEVSNGAETCNSSGLMEGGFGIGSTAHGVVVSEGSTTAAVATAAGATNQVLLGNTGADPSFGAVPVAALASGSSTINGQTCTLGSTCDVNSGATSGTVAVNAGAGTVMGAGPVSANILTDAIPVTGVARTTTSSQSVSSAELSGIVATSGSNVTTLGGGATAPALQVPFNCSGAGSGTAQTCSTSQTFVAAAGNCISFTPGTTNTGDVTVAVNGGSAFHVYKWANSSTLSSGDMVIGVTENMCLDTNNHWQWPTVGNPPASGATINNQNQYGAPYYALAGSNNTLSGVAPPATQGYFNNQWVNTTSAATVPQPVQVGLGGRSITGSATNCGTSGPGGTGILYSDVNSWIDHDQAATGSVTCTMNTPTLLNNSGFAFRYTNHSLQDDTFDPHSVGGLTVQAGNSAAANTLTIKAGNGCGIKVDPANPTTNLLADCSTAASGTGTVTHSVAALAPTFAPVVANGGADIQSEGGGELSIVLVGASTEVCGPINTALLAAQAASVVQPIISLRGIPINLTCNQDPFAGFTSTQGFTLDIGGGQITTDVPWFIPFHGKVIGSNGRGAFITASAAFRTAYPAIVGNSTTDQICLTNNSATVVAGTWVTGSPSQCVQSSGTATSTATFTPSYNAAALASPPAALGSGTCSASGSPSFTSGYCFGYYLLISPNGVAPTAANTLSVGQVIAASSQSLTLAGVINGNVIHPAAGTGYQFALVMPVVSLAMRNSIDPTYGDQTQFDGIGIGAGDPTTSSHGLNCHILFMNNYYQENSWLRNSFLTNACWAYVMVHGNAANSGPYSNIYALSSTDYSGYNATTGSVGISIRQVGTIHGFTDSTFNLRAGGTLTANPIIFVSNFRAVAGGFGVPNYGAINFKEMHLEPGVGGDSVLIGDTENWPWASGGEGASGAVFTNITGTPLNTTGNLFHISATTGATFVNQNIVIEGSGTEQTDNCIQDDVNSVTYQNCPPMWIGPATANAAINDGAETLFGPLNVGVVGTAGVLGLLGSTSGTATFTAPAVAGTTTNAVTSSNRLSAPQLQSSIATGTAPLIVASTTNVANLNASSLGGATFAAPGAIGGTTAGSALFTTLGASGQISGTANGAASTPPLLLSGTWFTGGSSSTTQPQLFINGSGSAVTGFSTAGTGLALNAVTGFTGNFIDSFLNGGASHLFTVSYQGVIINGTLPWNDHAVPTGNLSLAMGADTSIFTTTTAEAQMFAWKNTTAAVVGTSQGSPVPAVCGTAFHGSASVESCATWSILPGNGNDAAITVSHGVTGTSTGAVTDTFPGSVTGLNFTTNGTTAGFVDLPQGTTSAAVAPCNAATSICIMAPTSVTSQLRVLASAPATGFPLFTNSSGTMTETITPVGATISAGTALFGGASYAVNTVIASTVANVAGHFTNLESVTSLGGSCTTHPQFNVFDGTSNTGTAVTASASTQTKGTSVDQAQTQTFAAGDIIGIYISTAGGTCTTDIFTVSAQYSIP